MAILEVKNISKSFDSLRVLKDISFNVEVGEVVAIIGPSGSGKSTLLRCINQLEKADGGEINVDGVNMFHTENGKAVYAPSKTLRDIRLKIGLVFQNFNLLPRQSALENVELPLLYAGVGKKERRQRAKAALEKVGLAERMFFKPTQLSGGQKQRVAIARAIVNNPKLLLADEPTGALDTKSGNQVMELFKELNDDGVTIVMITHEPDIARCAKRITYIHDGELHGERAAEQE